MARKKKRPTAAQKRRQIRTALIQRWDQLADDVHRLVRALRAAPAGTFTEWERDDAIHELDNTVWDVMVNSRPRLPASDPRKVSRSQAQSAMLRREWVVELPDDELAELLKKVCPKKFREYLAGNPVELQRTAPV